LLSYIERKLNWDPVLLASARGSIIYTWTEKEETIEDLLNQVIILLPSFFNFINYFSECQSLHEANS